MLLASHSPLPPPPPPLSSSPYHALPRGQLSQVAELLASQHAQVLQLESSDAVSSEQLCSERLAEQQLRIKHARLHQRLLDAQHQMKMLSLVSDTSMKVGGAPWNDVGGAPPISSPPPESGSRHKVITEQSRHDLQQSKVRVCTHRGIILHIVVKHSFFEELMFVQPSHQCVPPHVMGILL